MKRIELSHQAYRAVIIRLWILCVIMALLGLVLSLVGTPLPLLLGDVFSLCMLMLILCMLPPAPPLQSQVPGHDTPTEKAVIVAVKEKEEQVP